MIGPVIRSLQEPLTETNYLNIIMMFEIGFGVSAPLVIFYLAILHLVPYRTMRERWRYVA